MQAILKSKKRIMELEELKRNLEKSLIDIKRKMNEIDALIQKQEVPVESLKDAHDRLKTLYDEIVLQYDQIDAMKAGEEVRMSEMGKNIYKSLESFDAVYKSAGSLFEGNEFGKRDHSVDFKNPFGTK